MGSSFLISVIIKNFKKVKEVQYEQYSVRCNIRTSTIWRFVIVLVSAMIKEELHMFKNHPFHVNDDKEMEELVESIREHGVLIPGIVRPIAEVRH